MDDIAIMKSHQPLSKNNSHFYLGHTPVISETLNKFGSLHISSCWVKIRLHTENQIPRLPEIVLNILMWGGIDGVGQPISVSLPTQVEVDLACDNKPSQA